jgi:hypothetical protein
MFLKGGLSKKGSSLADLKNLSHNLPNIWAQFKTTFNDKALDQFDNAIASLHRIKCRREGRSPHWVEVKNPRRRPRCDGSRKSRGPKSSGARSLIPTFDYAVSSGAARQRNAQDCRDRIRPPSARTPPASKPGRRVHLGHPRTPEHTAQRMSSFCGTTSRIAHKFSMRGVAVCGTRRQGDTPHAWIR